MRVEPRGLLRSLLLALSVATAPAHAQTITPTLKACMAVPDGPARLACYDTEMRRIEGAAAADSSVPSSPAAGAPPAASAAPAASAPPAASAAPAAAAAPPAASAAPPVASATPAESPKDQFGLPPAEPKGMPSRITAQVASATRAASGRYIVTLENGQVWLQTDDELGFHPRHGSSVSIKRGMLGAYWMSDKYYVVAVKRLQ